MGIIVIEITVAYATSEKQVEIQLKIEESCTIAIAIKRSGILRQFPEINLGQAIVGIHNKQKMLDAGLQNDDRIEIYRPLIINPRQARLLRAKRSKNPRK